MRRTRHRHLPSLAAALGLALGACGDASRTPERDTLMQLADAYWETYLAADPVTATILGDRRYDHLLSDPTPAARAAHADSLRALRARVQALDPQRLDAADRITHRMLLEVLDGDLATLECDFASWVVDPLGGPQVAFFNVPSFQPAATPSERAALLSRWRAMGPWIDVHVANLLDGLQRGRVATRDQVARVIEELDDLLARPDRDWTLMQPARTLPDDVPADERRQFADDLASVVANVVRPALQRYRAFLAAEVQPAARPADRVGLGALPDGDACYRRMIRRYTSLDLTPQAIHDIGLAECARIMAALADLGESVLGTRDRAAILQRLRTDPAMHFTTREEVEATARAALERATAAIPEWFGILPQAPCEVVRMQPHEEKHSTIAYYRQPAPDGSRPGRYTINTYAPETRPRYEAEALAFHEAIPGHHLQIAIAQELEGLPAFRRHRGTTAFVEGWGLYAERLADDMGLYTGDPDRIGMLSFDAWRACRLVVDTGMHALGWSRDQAIQFMLEHSALAENNIVNEVDRYITWPGQALAYKLGQREILALREAARAARGDAFNIRSFHDVVLRNGAVSLSVLRQQVREHFGLDAAP